jgi:putative addiction module component (TIGR02574 family)
MRLDFNLSWQAIQENSMETQLEILEAQALKLTTSERAHLAEHLIASLDEDGEIEEAWAAEVERRIAEIDGGHVQMIPAEEAIARARESLK